MSGLKRLKQAHSCVWEGRKEMGWRFVLFSQITTVIQVPFCRTGAAGTLAHRPEPYFAEKEARVEYSVEEEFSSQLFYE